MLRSSITIESARLNLNIGWGELERSDPQEIDLTLKIHLGELPPACKTERLEDTVCYAKLIETARNYCRGKEFKLLEKLGYELWNELALQIPQNSEFELILKKVNPPMERVLGGCAFELKGLVQ